MKRSTSSTATLTNGKLREREPQENRSPASSTPCARNRDREDDYLDSVAATAATGGVAAAAVAAATKALTHAPHYLNKSNLAVGVYKCLVFRRGLAHARASSRSSFNKRESGAPL